MTVDGRGSDSQRKFYDLLKEIYPIYDIIYEYDIGELGQRIDMFIPVLGIAIEYQGRQHYNFSKFYHKDELAWNKSISYDKRKKEYLINKGVKFVEIPYNTKIKTSEKLKEYIDSIPYPNIEYIGIETKSNKQIADENKAKKHREAVKENIRNSDFHKEYVERQKQLRKQKYKERKEKMKKN